MCENVEEKHNKINWLTYTKPCWLITLCNKDFGAWDISTDSISLGVTDT